MIVLYEKYNTGNLYMFLFECSAEYFEASKSTKDEYRNHYVRTIVHMIYPSLILNYSDTFCAHDGPNCETKVLA